MMAMVVVIMAMLAAAMAMVTKSYGDGNDGGKNGGDDTVIGSTSNVHNHGDDNKDRIQ